MNKPVLLNFFAFSLDLIYFETMIFFFEEGYRNFYPNFNFRFLFIYLEKKRIRRIM